MVFYPQEWDLQITHSSLQYGGVDLQLQVNDCYFPGSLVRKLMSAVVWMLQYQWSGLFVQMVTMYFSQLMFSMVNFLLVDPG